jgi:exonuclease SbcC
MFRRITAKNFLSWEDLSFDFTPGVTLIEGFNLDDQTSEGSGKSAILNALCWGLYGRIPKDAKVDDVVREGHKSCEVTVELEDGTQIVRTRKPNDLYMVLAEGNSTYGRAKGKDSKETQTQIEAVIGMSFETFCQSVYFAQNYPNKFVTATEEEKVKILSEILDLKQFDRARAATMDRLRKLEVDSAVAEKAHASLEMAMNSVDRQQRDYEALRERMQRERLERVRRLITDRDQVLQERSELASQLAELPEVTEQDRENLTQFVAECEAIKERVNQSLFNCRHAVELRQECEAARSEIEQSVLKRDQFNVDERRLELTMFQNDAQLIVEQKAELSAALAAITKTQKLKDDTFKMQVRRLNDVKRLQGELDRLRNPGNQTCPSCGTLLSAADPTHIEVAILEKEQELRAAELEHKNVVGEYEAIQVRSDAELREELESLSNVLREIEAQKQKLETEFRNYGYLVREIEQGRAKLLKLEEKLSTLPEASEDQLREELAQVTAAIAEARVQEKQLREVSSKRDLIMKDAKLQEGLLRKIEMDLEREEAVGTADVDHKLERLAAERQELLEKQQQSLEVLQSQRDNRARLQALKDGFKEIKAYVFGNILSELTRKANRYLVELFEVPVSIEFSNLSDDGDMAKIRVAVTYDGSERPLGLYSGGQFRRIQLAVDLALSEIVSARGAKPLQLRVLDEYFKDLSETSMDKALHLLEKLPGSTVLIEHNSIFRSIVRNVFRLELEAGTSRRVA